MGMMDDWAKKYGESKIGGIDPSAPPQQFLGQILNNFVGDKKAEDGDSVRESASPIDFIAPEAAGALSKVGSVAAEAAPRLIGNEIGSIGSNVKPIRQAGSTFMGGPERAVVDESIPMAKRIQDAAAKSSVNKYQSAEQAAQNSANEYYKGLPKDFFDVAKSRATENGVGASKELQTAMTAERQAKDADLRLRNQMQVDRFLSLKKALGGR